MSFFLKKITFEGKRGYSEIFQGGQSGDASPTKNSIP